LLGGPEKAGVGGSIPSLATTFSTTYKAIEKRLRSETFQSRGGVGQLSRLGWSESTGIEEGAIETFREMSELPAILSRRAKGRSLLATEFVGRNPRRYAALLALTGGLIGPPGAPIKLIGDLAGTPVLLSSGDPDPHVPWARVQESADLLQEIGGRVTLRRYPGKPHSVADEELRSASDVLAAA
jgi:acetyl esterase/lipase